ncbi:MAG: hypothetical protein ACJ735_06475 [Actinomycetes bacterium]
MRVLSHRLRLREPAGVAVLLALVICLQAATAGVLAARRSHPPVPTAVTSYAAGPRDPRIPYRHPRPAVAPPRHRAAVKHVAPPRRVVHKPPPRKLRPPRPHTDTLVALRGLSAWVDLYDYGKSGPAAAAALADTAAAHGVRTIWVETSRYNTPNIAYAGPLSALLDRAAVRHLHVIAWVLPEFRSVSADLAKARAAAAFRSRGGHRFAALGLDIEVSEGASAAQRSSRLIALARALHGHIGVPLVSIVPPPVGFSHHPSYWPGFPWRTLAGYSEAIATMGYWSASHNAEPGGYTRTVLAQTRSLVGRSSYPIHVIGGLASDTSPAGVASFCRVARSDHALGASLYDLASTPASLWAPLQACRRVGS